MYKRQRNTQIVHIYSRIIFYQRKIPQQSQESNPGLFVSIQRRTTEPLELYLFINYVAQHKIQTLEVYKATWVNGNDDQEVSILIPGSAVLSFSGEELFYGRYGLGIFVFQHPLAIFCSLLTTGQKICSFSYMWFIETSSNYRVFAFKSLVTVKFEWKRKKERKKEREREERDERKQLNVTKLQSHCLLLI